MFINLNEDNTEQIKYGILKQMCKDYYALLKPIDKVRYIGHDKLYETMCYRRRKEIRAIERYVVSEDFKVLFNIDGELVLRRVELMYETGEKLVF